MKKPRMAVAVGEGGAGGLFGVECTMTGSGRHEGMNRRSSGIGGGFLKRFLDRVWWVWWQLSKRK